VPSGKITGTRSKEAWFGLGIKLPNGTNGAKAKPVPAAPINFRKSLRDNPLDFFVPSSDIQAHLRQIAYKSYSIILKVFA
jgi:hypothetical protein